MGVVATLPELSEWTLTKKLVCRDFSLHFGQLVYWSERAKEANLKKSDWSQFKVLMAIFLTKFISLFVNDYQFLYYVLKHCLSVLELIRAHWSILYCSL